MKALGAGAVGSSLAGCTETNEHDDHDHGHDHDHDHDHNYEEPQAEAIQKMVTDDGQHFIPHVVWIEEGGTVTYKLESGAHDTVAYHPDNEDVLPTISEYRMPEDADPWASEMMTGHGDTYEVTFEKEGVYDHVCTPHEGVGMIGTVLVGEPHHLEDEPGMAEPQDELPEAAKDAIQHNNDIVRDILEGDDHHH